MYTSRKSLDAPMDISGGDCDNAIINKNDVIYQTNTTISSGLSPKCYTNSRSAKISSPAVIEQEERLDNVNDEFEEIKQIFDSKLSLVEKWLREEAPISITSKIREAADDPQKSPKIRTASVTSDLFQQWLASSPVQVL